MTPVANVRAVPVDVQIFLDTVAAWPAARWRRCVAAERATPATERRVIARALCDAVLAADGRQLDAWFTSDAAETTASVVEVAVAPVDHLLVTTLLTDAALAILARPALPTLDLALLLAPFLPLHFPQPARQSAAAHETGGEGGV
jgi:hypothetical protein